MENEEWTEIRLQNLGKRVLKRMDCLYVDLYYQIYKDGKWVTVEAAYDKDYERCDEGLREKGEMIIPWFEK